MLNIKNNNLNIEIKNKITEMNNEEILEIFALVRTFYECEKKKGNICNKADLILKYVTNMTVIEYLNIYNIIKIPLLYEFAEYFIKFKKKHDEQSIDTKINLNDYIIETENISQKITLNMMFEIKTTKESIIEKSNKMISMYYNDEIIIELFEEIRKK